MPPAARSDGPAQKSAAATSTPSTPIVTPDEGFFGYTFKDRGLLTLALTHSSLAYESNPERTPDPGSDNERLEFLGDAVLGLVAAEALYRRVPALREGDLTRLRASLVSSRHLAQVAQRMQLGPMLLLGRGEAHSGGHKKPALLANALEAVIAALYLDGGLAAAREFIHRHIIEPAEDSLVGVLRSSEPFSGAVGDYKSALQERLQAAGHDQPQYILAAQSGPDHQKRFRIEVRVAGADGVPLTLASADGSTKKQAQQEAARLAFASLTHWRAIERETEGAIRREIEGESDSRARRRHCATEGRAMSLAPGPGGEATTHHHSLLHAFQSLLYILVVALFIMTFTAQPFRIPSASMEPTLLVGDFLLVNKEISTGRFPALTPANLIRRGDLIVFHYPVDPALHLVKRVIGLPGDRLRLRDGRV